MPIAVILAGGQSRRMGHDKAEIQFHGKRLIDHVIERLSAQVDRIVLSAGQDYGTGFHTIADAQDFEGPVAGLYGVADWLALHEPEQTGFLTVPVDGPYLPADLAAKLIHESARCALAVDKTGHHPTFAYWTLSALHEARAKLPGAPSLYRLAKRVDAQSVNWPGERNFINLNTPDDLADNSE